MHSEVVNNLLFFGMDLMHPDLLPFVNEDEEVFAFGNSIELNAGAIQDGVRVFLDGFRARIADTPGARIVLPLSCVQEDLPKEVISLKGFLQVAAKMVDPQGPW